MSSVLRNRLFAYKKKKTQISFAVIAKLISVFVFATRIVQSLYFLNTKFQASSHLVWLYSLVCVGPGRKPRRLVFWQRGSYCIVLLSDLCYLCWTRNILSKLTKIYARPGEGMHFHELYHEKIVFFLVVNTTTVNQLLLLAHLSRRLMVSL